LQPVGRWTRLWRRTALSLLYNEREALSKSYQLDAATRASNFTRMQQVLTRIERDVPGAIRSTDSAGRETDIAIDHSEFTHLPPPAIAQVVQIMQAEGLQATVSSIHINGWIGSHNKLQGAHWIVQTLFQRDLPQEMHCWAYVGDSTNDQLMFEAFDNSIGVANIKRFVPELKHLPRYIARSERGAGFAEVAAFLNSSAR
jgi:hydroxymethylpyrimidine pyrophosphatase-like HAD family hydrolase